MKFQSHPNRASAHRKASGFTLIEILVVLAIIAILAALLFPAFKGARENAKQSSCATNLQQVYLAVRQYYDDEKKYPANLAVLLPPTENLADGAAAPAGTPAGTPMPNVKGTGFLKSTTNLVCPDDDTDALGNLRSSYSNVATSISGAAGPNTAAPIPDLGRYVWNYWGYKADGFAYDKQDDATYLAPGASSDTTTFANDVSKRYLRDPGKAYNATVAPTDPAYNPVDLQKLPRLANRRAPQDTIITHCVYHRLPTSNLADPYGVYTDTPNAAGAIDMVLRLDGTAVRADVTTWKGEKWIKQTR